MNGIAIKTPEAEGQKQVAQVAQVVRDSRRASEVVSVLEINALLAAANQALQALDYLYVRRGYMDASGARTRLNDALQPFAARIAKLPTHTPSAKGGEA